MTQFRWLTGAIAGVVTLVVCTSLILAQMPIVRIGVALDGPSRENDALRETFEREIAIMLEGEFTVRFPPDKCLEADWTASGVSNVIDRLLNDPEVDQVLTLGILTSLEAARRSQLPKPVFAPFVLAPALQGIPSEIQEERLTPTDRVERTTVSGVPNLSYLTLGANLLDDIIQFHQIVPFSRLTILMLGAWLQDEFEVERRIQSALIPLNLDRIEVVPVGASLESALDAIPADAQAVYVTPLPRFSAADFDRLVSALIERRLPSFSLQGRREVEQGLLASLGPEKETLRRARRVALNLQKVLLGQAAAELSVEYRRKTRLTINMATARAVGASPPYSLLIEADLLNEEMTQATRTLSLPAVVREASVVNLDLAVADQTVAAGLERVREARSGLLPNLNLFGAATYIDRDRADAFSLGQQQYSTSLTARQLLYSDRVWANYGIEQNLQDLREEERAQFRLDVILEAAQGYLNVLRAKTIERIQKDNLGLTRTNLELSQSRVDIGVAGREEVFRWESQLAANQKEVIEAEAFGNQATILVNQVLNRPLDETFLTVEAGLDDPELVSSFEELGPYIDNPDSFAVFDDFMVEEALGGSPELRQLDAAIRAQERELLASKRDFFLPDVAFVGDITGIDSHGKGTDVPMAGPNAWDWTLRVDATLPLFEGGALRARRSRAERELEGLRIQRDALQQRVEQRIRTVLEDTRASFIGIELSRRAATAARRNLDLVTDAYAEGVADILRLLDAQNQALVADLVGANAIFDYLIDLMGSQRAVGRFDYYRSPQDRQAFLSRLDDFFRNAGQPLRTP